eukprot:CAMPEP_0198114262 /NCGR_PEP_ID=MMETSP1442-20131203/5695_1 /TAXON_ID= /ORGANISM="Craspedostauros australis, Strain CCMP3328" /LENGTH=63 /DNA_ID=CAMNT_0043771535 /DNA_START=159 /DNA_END=347 /DNA_ORIENTATION=+
MTMGKQNKTLQGSSNTMYGIATTINPIPDPSMSTEPPWKAWCMGKGALSERLICDSGSENSEW